MARLLRALIVLVVVGGVALYYRDHVTRFALQAYREVAPCAVPITYSIEHIDPRFGISTSSLETALADAASVWSEAAGKTLFQVSQRGSIEVRLEYDERQATTETLREIGGDIEENIDTYESLKEEYVRILAAYDAKEAAFDARYAAYLGSLREYERDVRMWNSRGGAPRAQYEALQARERSLDAEASDLGSLQSQLRNDAEAVNALASQLNALARRLNMSVDAYNTVGESVADEFEEAVYESIPGRETITVYEFGSVQKLTRVLAHEFGHALGIEHVDDDDSIMYRINKGSDVSLTADDAAALSAACRQA